MCGELRTNAVRQPFLLAHALRQPRVQKAAAEHVVGEHQRRIVRVVVAHLDHLPGQQHRVGLVRRFDVHFGGLHRLEWARHALVGLRGVPIGEDLLQHRRDLVCVEIADDGDRAALGAVEGGPEIARFRNRHRPAAGNPFVEGRHVEDAVFGLVAAGVAGNGVRHQRGGFGTLRLQGGQRFLPQQFELLRVEGRLPQQFPEQPQRRRQVLADGRRRTTHLQHAAAQAAAYLQAVALVDDLLARALRGAAREHLPGEARRGGFAGQGVLRAVAEGIAVAHGAATVLLRQQRHFDAACEGELARAALDVLRRRLERLALGQRFAALVVRHQGGHVRRFGNHRPWRRLVRGVEEAKCAVGRQQIGARRRQDILGRHRRDPIPMQKQQPPIAHRRPLAQLQGDGLRVVEGQVEAGRVLGLGAVHLLLGRRFVHHAMHGGEHRLGGSVQAVFLAHFGHRQQQTRLAELKGQRSGRSGQPGRYQALVEPAGGLGAQQIRQHLHRRELRVRPSGDVVGRNGQLHVAHPPQRHAALAVLGRFGGVRLEQRVGAGALGARDGSEVLRHQLDRALRVEAPGHHQHRVVRLVVLAVEGAQAFERHVLDVRPCADGGVAVVVPQVGGGHHPLQQHGLRAVFASLPLVAHHGHLGFQVLGGDERVHHPVRFQVQGPVQVVLVRRKGLVVVGAVHPRRAVGEGAAFGEFVVDARVVGGALEHQMLQQMRHAGLAVALVPGAHQIGDVHGDLLLALIRKEQKAQAVLQPVLGDALHAGHGLHCARRCLRCRFALRRHASGNQQERP